MAQEPRSPWSRWDLPTADVRQIGSITRQQFDNPPPNLSGNYMVSTSNSDSDSSPFQRFVEASLITKELNANDPSFYNCIYGVPNSLQQVIQECHVDVDCCERTCCDSNWRTKYAFAIALLALFCVIVLISLLIWLIVWLVNRSSDKKQRDKLAEPGSYNSQMNIVTQAGGNQNNRRF